ncbi:sensor histidine kinase [Spirochaeta dissipatitropha]
MRLKKTVSAAAVLLCYTSSATGLLFAAADSPAGLYYIETISVYLLGLVLMSGILLILRSRSSIRGLILVKVILTALLLYTAPDRLLLILPVLAAVCIEQAFYLGRTLERIGFQIFTAVILLWTGSGEALLGVNTFLLHADEVSPLLNAAAMLSTALLVSFFSLLLSAALDSCTVYRELAERQELSLQNLSEFNQKLQRWAQEADQQSAERERNRISRELHDIAGYMFTNLIALMDAAMSTGKSNPSQLADLLTSARRQAQEGLQETRVALRRQRAVQPESRNSSRTIAKITSIFQEVTGTRVELQLGNLPQQLDADLSRTLYRIVQESLTNAIRHGKASLVQLHFWIHKDNLIINIHDNGIGSTEITKGIGLAGMEERVSRLQGSIEAGNAEEGGFRLHIRIPYGTQIESEQTGSTGEL